MSADPVYPRADRAARTVDPMVLAHALDHIAKTAAKSRTSTRRLRWIEQRAIFALDGREYRDIDLDLPKQAPEESQIRLKLERARLRAEKAELLAALIDLHAQVSKFCETEGEADFYTGRATAAIAQAKGDTSHG